MVRKCISGGRESQEQWAVPELSGKYFCKGCGWAKKPEPCGSGFSVGWFARIKPVSCRSDTSCDAFDFVFPPRPMPQLITDHSTCEHQLLSDKNVRPTRTYAVLLGLRVKSRTWVRMLDICIPFSCETNGSISAMNGSFTNSLISS